MKKSKVILVLFALIITIMIFYFCNRSKRIIDFSLPKNTSNSIIKPQQVFQSNIVLREESNYYIRISNQKPFKWEIPEDISEGRLTFRVLWSCLKAKEKKDDYYNTFIPTVHLEVTKIGKINSNSLISKKVIQFKLKKKLTGYIFTN